MKEEEETRTEKRRKEVRERGEAMAKDLDTYYRGHKCLHGPLLEEFIARLGSEFGMNELLH